MLVSNSINKKINITKSTAELIQHSLSSMHFEQSSNVLVVLYLFCAELTIVCDGQWKNYARNDARECPTCCVETANEISNKLISVKENVKVKLVAMTTLEQQIQQELNNTMRDILDLVNRINGECSKYKQNETKERRGSCGWDA